MRPKSTVPRLRTVVLALLGLLISVLPALQPLSASAAGTNLAAGKTMTSSGVSQTYVPANANDGDQSTYWESANNAFPQWLQVDLGASVGVNQVVLKLPPSTDWATRTQTLSVQGSSDGSNFSDIVASTGYTFDPSTANTVTINFTSVTTRYVRLLITANTGWPAGQVSEFEVYGPSTGDTTPPSAPTDLAYTQPQSGQINLTWNASTDNVGVTGYDVYANDTLVTSVPASALTYTDTQPASATVTYYVRAHDAAGNQSGNSNSVTRTGQSGDTQAPTAPGGLAYTQPQSGQIKLTWTASTDNVGVTGYDVFLNGAKITSVSGTTLTYTDTQADTATVSYYVEAHDAAGNQSAASNTVTRTGSGGSGSNLAVGKPITGSANTYIYVPANANDNDPTTYFEGSSYPSTLTVSLGANADVSSVVVKLNPDASWATRTQTIQVLGREQSATGFTSISAAQQYTFNPGSGNTVTIPVSARVADVELNITSNSGAPGGQVAEFQVIGTPAPNPDLTVTDSSWSPGLTGGDRLGHGVGDGQEHRHRGGPGQQRQLLPGHHQGRYRLRRRPGGGRLQRGVGGDRHPERGHLPADREGRRVEHRHRARTTPTTATPTRPTWSSPRSQSSDLVASSVDWTPSNPAAGNTVTFSVTLKNQGTIASASGSHAITLDLKDSTGATVKTLTGSYSGTLGAGPRAHPGEPGHLDGGQRQVHRAHGDVAVDANELAVKQANNTSDTPLFVGRGANMPYDVVRGRGRPDRRRRDGGRPEPDHRRPRR